MEIHVYNIQFCMWLTLTLYHAACD